MVTMPLLSSTGCASERRAVRLACRLKGRRTVANAQLATPARRDCRGCQSNGGAPKQASLPLDSWCIAPWTPSVDAADTRLCTTETAPTSDARSDGDGAACSAASPCSTGCTTTSQGKTRSMHVSQRRGARRLPLGARSQHSTRAVCAAARFTTTKQQSALVLLLPLRATTRGHASSVARFAFTCHVSPSPQLNGPRTAFSAASTHSRRLLRRRARGACVPSRSYCAKSHTLALAHACVG